MANQETNFHLPSQNDCKTTSMSGTQLKSRPLPSAPVAPPRNSPPQTWSIYYSTFRMYLKTCQSCSSNPSPAVPADDTRSFRCERCSLTLPSRNQLFIHLAKTHQVYNKSNPAPSGKDQRSKSSLRRIRKRQKQFDLARIAQLESEIAMAKLNSTSLTTINEDTELIVGLSRNGKKGKASRTDVSHHHRRHIRKLNTLPANTVPVGYSDLTNYQRRPGNAPDLDEFENLDLPGFQTYDLVHEEKGTFLCKRPKDAEFRDALSRRRPASCIAQNLPKLQLNRPSRYQEAGPSKDPDYEDFLETLDGFDNFTKFRDRQPEPKPPLSFPETNFESRHERRESIFTRDGDDELFDSE